MSAPKQNRRQARIQAAQQLYAREMRGALPPAAEEQPCPPLAAGDELQPFAREIIDGAIVRLAEIDRLLGAALQNWNLRRLGAVDRAILRGAVAEMLIHSDIPAAVTINEAIEIARDLASSDSARFANGVLDRVRQEIGRDPRATN